MCIGRNNAAVCEDLSFKTHYGVVGGRIMMQLVILCVDSVVT